MTAVATPAIRWNRIALLLVSTTLLYNVAEAVIYEWFSRGTEPVDA